MPVDSEHPQYKIRKEQWAKCRHTIAGSDRVKGETTAYLPQLGGQDIQDYDAYLKRALFYGASGRTIQALMGAIFRKNFIIEYPDFLEEQLEAITLDGQSFELFVRNIVEEVLTLGRVGILPDVLTTANNARPYLAVYTGEHIINWREMLIGSQKMLTMVVLKEQYEEIKDDGFEWEIKNQYRVLSLGQEERNRSVRYIQDVFRKVSSVSNEYVPVADLHVAPVRMGTPITEIPFEFINTYDCQPETDKPPLLDLVEVNLSHYRTSADLEHGAHYTALPTAWVAGFPADAELKIGSGSAWVSEETDAKASFLEYTGQGLGALRDLKKDKENLMAVLGARLLEDQKKAAEAADTLRIRAASETGSLTAITKNISNGIENALKTLAWWSGASDKQVADIKFELNTDFSDTRLPPQEVAELMKMYQAGAISQDTFLFNLKRGELLPDDRSIEDEKDLLEMNQGNNIDLTNITPIRREFNIQRDEEGRAQGLREV